VNLYFAYGSNLNMRRFFSRCPDAYPLCGATLRGWRLRFAGGGHADVVRGSRADFVPGAVYACNDRDMFALDRYEGVCRGAVDSGYYKRKIATVRRRDVGSTLRAVMYVMTPGHHDAEPSDLYLNVVLAGIRDWDLPVAPAIAVRAEMVER